MKHLINGFAGVLASALMAALILGIIAIVFGPFLLLLELGFIGYELSWWMWGGSFLWFCFSIGVCGNWIDKINYD